MRANGTHAILAHETSLWGGQEGDVTELVWDGKYTADGKRAAHMRVALPFQTVETVNESTRERQLALAFSAHDRDGEWRNRLM